MKTRRRFTCNKPGHLQKDHWKYEGKNGVGPLQPKEPPQSKSAQERAKLKLSARLSCISGKPSKVKGVPYLNPDPYCQFIGPKNWGEALIDDELMTCLLDNVNV